MAAFPGLWDVAVLAQEGEIIPHPDSPMAIVSIEVLDVYVNFREKLTNYDQDLEWLADYSSNVDLLDGLHLLQRRASGEKILEWAIRNHCKSLFRLYQIDNDTLSKLSSKYGFYWGYELSLNHGAKNTVYTGNEMTYKVKLAKSIRAPEPLLGDLNFDRLLITSVKDDYEWGFNHSLENGAVKLDLALEEAARVGDMRKCAKLLSCGANDFKLFLLGSIHGKNPEIFNLALTKIENHDWAHILYCSVEASFEYGCIVAIENNVVFNRLDMLNLSINQHFNWGFINFLDQDDEPELVMNKCAGSGFLFGCHHSINYGACDWKRLFHTSSVSGFVDGVTLAQENLSDVDSVDWFDYESSENDF